MQALGNDFILIDNRRLNLKTINRLSKNLCDRRFGIGADQLLLLDTSKKADSKMRIFNADGTEVEMCGNGIRCLAKYIWDNKLETRKLAIETMAGIMKLEKSGPLFKVDMGEPILTPEKIPVSSPVTTRLSSPTLRSMPKDSPKSRHPVPYGTGRHTSRVINYSLKINSKNFKINCVSMGNPHTIIVVNNVQTVPLNNYGPLIEKHRFFPKRTNVEFIQILNRKNIKMRVWERGAGETKACGTGAAAGGVASSLLGLTNRKISVHPPGGKLLIEWSSKDNHVYMTGPAEKVFEGTINIK